MNNELMSCPFCKGQALIEGTIFAGEKYRAAARCLDCGATVASATYHDADTAIIDAQVSWNTRAERTCRPVPKYDDDTPWPVMVCSECGRAIHYDEDENGSLEYPPYCCCGAKVVYDD